MNLTLYEHLREDEADVLPGRILFYSVGKDGIRARTLPGGKRCAP